MASTPYSKAPATPLITSQLTKDHALLSVAFADASKTGARRLAEATAIAQELVSFFSPLVTKEGTTIQSTFHTPLIAVQHPLLPQQSIANVIATLTFSNPNASQPVSLYLSFYGACGTMDSTYAITATARYGRDIVTGGGGKTVTMDSSKLIETLREVARLLWGFSIP